MSFEQDQRCEEGSVPGDPAAGKEDGRFPPADPVGRVAPAARQAIATQTAVSSKIES